MESVNEPKSMNIFKILITDINFYFSSGSGVLAVVIPFDLAFKILLAFLALIGAIWSIYNAKLQSEKSKLDIQNARLEQQVIEQQLKNLSAHE